VLHGRRAHDPAQHSANVVSSFHCMWKLLQTTVPSKPRKEHVVGFASMGTELPGKGPWLDSQLSCSLPTKCRGLKRGTLGGRSPEALALLSPQLPLLVRALGSRSAAVVSLALRVLASLVQLPLKGVQRDPALEYGSSACPRS